MGNEVPDSAATVAHPKAIIALAAAHMAQNSDQGSWRWRVASWLEDVGVHRPCATGRWGPCNVEADLRCVEHSHAYRIAQAYLEAHSGH